ncbi:AmmeMemoRadiSam system protein B [Neptunomonas antarctica]|uniref:MEMO1 family protein SAMN05421760_1154 n=1 Tax=Neptunomonas antarctica TaxID=619304 RepID=A0A1N7PHJ5_9GAMM|nr:AmmeMemoRadiSam system protein B [Neptunomonas antarctica]SIT09990.1 hypothetical protein SAMN05421760_1154 [Neptunomonas antarctica]
MSDPIHNSINSPINSSMNIRPAAVAGFFYPEDKDDLYAMLARMVPEKPPIHFHASNNPKALIVPHAGYMYSGAIAGQGYGLLRKGSVYDAVYLFGPNHRVALHGCALPESDAFETPLGRLKVDQKAVQELLKSPLMIMSDEVHAQEHCVEVQLPFLQFMRIDMPIVPVVVGECPASEIADIIEPLLNDPTKLVIISTDLSHFHSYSNAVKIDERTGLKIMNADHDIQPTEACGCHALNGLLLAVKRQNLTIEKIAMCNSGDTAGDQDRVVGYGCYGIY